MNCVKRSKKTKPCKSLLHLSINNNVKDKACVLASFHGLNLSEDYSRLINTNFRYTFLGFPLDEVRSMVANITKHDEDYSKFVNYFHHLYSLKVFYDHNDTEYIDTAIRVLHSIYSDSEAKELGLPTVLDIYNLSQSKKTVSNEDPISDEKWNELLDFVHNGKEDKGNA